MEKRKSIYKRIIKNLENEERNLEKELMKRERDVQRQLQESKIEARYIKKYKDVGYKAQASRGKKIVKIKNKVGIKVLIRLR